jgi:hypothetical protein
MTHHFCIRQINTQAPPQHPFCLQQNCRRPSLGLDAACAASYAGRPVIYADDAKVKSVVAGR